MKTFERFTAELQAESVLAENALRKKNEHARRDSMLGLLEALRQEVLEFWLTMDSVLKQAEVEFSCHTGEGSKK